MPLRPRCQPGKANAGQNAAGESIVNRWDEVQDFNWLKAEPSPNWSILPLTERLHVNDVERLLNVKQGPDSVEQILQDVGMKAGGNFSEKGP